jgi:ATP-dependent Clp protease adaptor protein ClpS
VPIAAPDQATVVVDEVLTVEEPVRPWICLVWNDPVNTMNYVSYVFRSYFGYSRQKAETLMLRVHNLGKAVVAEGSREEMETHVRAMHDFGLQSTLEQDS